MTPTIPCAEAPPEMASSLAVVLKRVFPTRPSRSRLAALALLGAAFDHLENAFAWRALAAFPERAAGNSLFGLASAAKTLTFWVAGLILLSGLATLLGRTARNWYRTEAGRQKSRH